MASLTPRSKTLQCHRHRGVKLSGVIGTAESNMFFSSIWTGCFTKCFTPFFHDASVFGFKIQGLTHVYVKVQGFEIFLEYFYRFLITMLTYTTPRSFIYDTVKFDKFFLSWPLIAVKKDNHTSKQDNIAILYCIL